MVVISIYLNLRTYAFLKGQIKLCVFKIDPINLAVWIKINGNLSWCRYTRMPGCRDGGWRVWWMEGLEGLEDVGGIPYGWKAKHEIVCIWGCLGERDENAAMGVDLVRFQHPFRTSVFFIYHIRYRSYVFYIVNFYFNTMRNSNEGRTWIYPVCIFCMCLFFLFFYSWDQYTLTLFNFWRKMCLFLSLSNKRQQIWVYFIFF